MKEKYNKMERSNSCFMNAWERLSCYWHSNFFGHQSEESHPKRVLQHCDTEEGDIRKLNYDISFLMATEKGMGRDGRCVNEQREKEMDF